MGYPSDSLVTQRESVFLTKYKKYFGLQKKILYITKYNNECSLRLFVNMALTQAQIASLLKLRGIGWSQKEIAETLGTSQQVVAYHLKKLKEESKKKSPEDVFSAALLGGMAVGAGLGALAMLLEQITKK